MKYREKIAEIIKKNGTYNGRSLSFDYYVVKPDDLATALIENDIGDIIEWKRRAEVAERALHLSCDITMENANIIVFPDTKTQVKNKIELYNYFVQQAKKEIEEERK